MRIPLTLTLLLALGCAPGQPPVRPEDLKAPRLTRGLPRPAFVAQRGDGSPFDFRTETSGKLTFLFFGYTHCPDVCPLHMANLAAAIHALPSEIAAQVQVVFVTTDPERDTPERLRSWLSNFDSTFVGLSGDAAALNAVQQSMGMPPAMRDAEPTKDGYTISHGAHLWAFTPDDSAHVVYPLGLAKEDLTGDIPKLLRLWPRPR
jgi:cytochrome oxidase Cu insertion factor (SCO1/SenC/PrrC family)